MACVWGLVAPMALAVRPDFENRIADGERTVMLCPPDTTVRHPSARGFGQVKLLVVRSSMGTSPKYKLLPTERKRGSTDAILSLRARTSLPSISTTRSRSWVVLLPPRSRQAPPRATAKVTSSCWRVRARAIAAVMTWLSVGSVYGSVGYSLSLPVSVSLGYVPAIIVDAWERRGDES